jgi:alpha-L-rhamnosidase
MCVRVSCACVRSVVRSCAFLLEDYRLTIPTSFYLIGAGFAADAPAWLQLTFGEVPGDAADPYLPYNGSLTSSWLPWETIHVDYLPEQVNMPRRLFPFPFIPFYFCFFFISHIILFRYAFRYVKVDILATSGTFSAQFANVTATGITSASSVPPPPPSSLSPLLKSIDAIGVSTLRDCMQTSFEDGPKRDRRLWLGV